MEKRTHNFLKGLGILFAVAAGIGTAVLGYVDRTDWIQVAFYSVAVVAIILWGWHFFLVRWSYRSLVKEDGSQPPETTETTSKRSLFWYSLWILAPDSTNKFFALVLSYCKTYTRIGLCFCLHCYVGVGV